MLWHHPPKSPLSRNVQIKQSRTGKQYHHPQEGKAIYTVGEQILLPGEKLGH